MTLKSVAAALLLAACGAAPELACRTRIARLQAEYGLIEPVGRATWRCADGSQLLSTFYPSDPPYARFERAGRSVVAAIAESGSGARYASPGDRFEYWEHQGEATVSWDGRATRCTK
jgi:membrane-bound inhibitor of C-type lysozyme